MSFVGHLLRENELFVDVGANVGSYTVLACAAAKARCISLEPVPASFAWLQKNVGLNGFAEQVSAHNLGAGAEKSILRFSEALDCGNRVLTAGEPGGMEVPVLPLDEIVGDAPATMLKVDVEGFESEVIRGAGRLLRQQSLLAILLERNGSGARYGFDEAALHDRIVDQGFSACQYDPLRRELSVRTEASNGLHPANMLYVREPARVQARLLEAPRFRILNREL
jgi:FkbM family methyltransferase